jgi:AcrR family transcriptional regulator
VIAEAVALADAQGLGAVTMRAVAARLGAAAMSLYSYVPDKQALVREMVEHVTREQQYPHPTGDWRADLHRLAHLQRALVLQHPWLVDAVSHVQPLNEGTLAYLEYGLAALEPLAVPPAAAMETLALMTGAVLNLVRSHLAAAAAPAPDPQQQADQHAGLASLLATGRFPRLATALTAASPDGQDLDLDAEFDRLLDRILDGLIPSGRPPDRDPNTRATR